MKILWKMSTILYNIIKMYSVQENLCKKNPLPIKRKGKNEKNEVLYETIKNKLIDVVNE